jgi:hypothetical protein
MKHASVARVTPVEEPGPILRVFYAIGRKLFGQVPTPEKIMAHRPALLLGIGGFYGASTRACAPSSSSTWHACPGRRIEWTSATPWA